MSGIFHIMKERLPSVTSPSSSSYLAVGHESPSSDPVQGRERATGGAVFPGWHASTSGGGGHQDQASHGQQYQLLGAVQPGCTLLEDRRAGSTGHQVPQTCTLLLR